MVNRLTYYKEKAPEEREFKLLASRAYMSKYKFVKAIRDGESAKRIAELKKVYEGWDSEYEIAYQARKQRYAIARERLNEPLPQPQYFSVSFD